MLASIDIELADRELARRSPGGLIRYVTQDRSRLPVHLQRLERDYLDLAYGRIDRLLDTVPVRHGKSVYTDQYGCPWYLGTWPDRKVILTSYEAHFAAMWGGYARDIIREHGEKLWGVRIKSGREASNDWELEHYLNGRWYPTGGGMRTAGVGGPITGKGAHLFIVDDPIKNQEEALSQLQREKIWNWINATADTRLEPDGAMIVTMARWHMDDLAGRILAQVEAGDEEWRVLNLPALALENDPLGRSPGEALWPERYSRTTLEKKRATLISRGQGLWWDALYQGRPTTEAGNKFKRAWFSERWTTLPGNIERVITFCDSPLKAGEVNDEWAFVTIALGRDGQFFVLNVRHGHWTTPEAKEQLVGIYRRMKTVYGAKYTFHGEDTAGFVALRQIMAADEPDVALIPSPAPSTSKEVRADLVTDLCESTRVKFPSQFHMWINYTLDQLTAFPLTDLDDVVDAFCQGLILLRGGARAIQREWTAWATPGV